MYAYTNNPQTQEQIWEVKCHQCLKVVARMTGDELTPFLYWLALRSELVLCFSCEDKLVGDLYQALLLEDGARCGESPAPKYTTTRLSSTTNLHTEHSDGRNE